MPDEEFNINKAAAEFLNQNLDRIAELGKGIFRGTADKIRLRLKSTYTAYLSNVLEQYSKTKSFLVRQDTPLYEVYVPLALSFRERRHRASRHSKDICSWPKIHYLRVGWLWEINANEAFGD